MLDARLFESALAYEAFFLQHGKPGDKERWDAIRAGIELTLEQRQTLKQFTRKTKVLVLAAAWCGDCVRQCPILEKFAEAAPVLQIRYLNRDSYPEARDELQINGGQRIPVVVFFSEDNFEVARFGERTLSHYRALGGAAAANPAAVVQEWLDVVERVQWILRLSPRLRRLHED